MLLVRQALSKPVKLCRRSRRWLASKGLLISISNIDVDRRLFFSPNLVCFRVLLRNNVVPSVHYYN